MKDICHTVNELYEAALAQIVSGLNPDARLIAVAPSQDGDLPGTLIVARKFRREVLR